MKNQIHLIKLFIMEKILIDKKDKKVDIQRKIDAATPINGIGMNYEFSDTISVLKGIIENYNNKVDIINNTIVEKVTISKVKLYSVDRYCSHKKVTNMTRQAVIKKYGDKKRTLKDWEDIFIKEKL